MNNSKVAKVLHLLFIPLLATLPHDAWGAGYTLIDLGTLGAADSYAYDVNDNRQVTGNSSIPSDELLHTFVWDIENGMQDIGTLGGSNSGGHGINNRGEIVGWSQISGDTAIHAFYYDGSLMQDVGTLGGTTSGSQAINDASQVTGGATIDTGDNHAFLFTDSVMQDLGTLGGLSSTGLGINLHEQVVGRSRIVDTSTHAFIWDANNGMQDLGTLGGLNSGAYAINNLGQVTGFSEYSPSTSNRHVFLWDKDNGMQDLGALAETFYTTAYAINDHAQITGSSDNRAFLWDEENGMRDLCDVTDCTAKGWSGLTRGMGINNSGDIAGDGVIDGENHAFLAIAQEKLVVTIDILPKSEVNAINLNNKGSIQVAVLSTDEFPAYNAVNPDTVEFGPARASATRYKVKDVNRDGLPDIIFYFKIKETGIECGDTEATLVGETYDGSAFEGVDSIVTKGCG